MSLKPLQSRSYLENTGSLLSVLMQNQGWLEIIGWHGRGAQETPDQLVRSIDTCWLNCWQWMRPQRPASVKKSPKGI
ncbi:MAG: hypothetical protein AAFR26_12320 [Cyanobacteria bacterium J06626_4]